MTYVYMPNFIYKIKLLEESIEKRLTEDITGQI